MSSELKTNKVSPATGTALQIGDSGDTVDIPSGATFDVTGATVTGLSAGKVLQVVTATDSTALSVTSGSFTNTALTASITCASTSNKVLVQAQAPVVGKRNDNWLYNPHVRFNESATSTNFPNTTYGFGSIPFYFTSSHANNRVGLVIPCLWLHSPSSTSELTYTLQMTNGNVTTGEYCEQTPNELAVMVLMEIEG